MFHVEQYIQDFFSIHGCLISLENHARLKEYIHLIHETNKTFNLTGFSSIQDIAEKLVLASIEPFFSLNVPRGTKFLDMGSGAGIPGIPLAIACEELTGTLVDSNAKKINFIQSVIQQLGLSNACALLGRGEELAHNASFRGSFFFSISRAFSNLYTTCEICAPFVETGGFLYIYANDALPEASFHPTLFNHFSELGIRPATIAERLSLGLGEKNIVFIKTSSTPMKYPRRFSVIKREAMKALRNL